mmetsp:Transcript_96161/g.140528  ORF Transcript_96161/g.140528 Transcript_96161/m.140528 type:complete len:229 (+) Transcript_96161:204-890(+)
MRGCVRACVCVCVYVRVCASVSLFAYAYNINTRKHTHTHTHTCECVYMYHVMSQVECTALHASILRAASTLGHLPLNIIPGCFDIASLAVHAILGIDHKFRFAGLVHYIFIDFGGAKAALWARIFLIRLGNRPISKLGFDGEVPRLVGLVIHATSRQVGENIKREHAVGLGVGDILVVSRFASRRVVALAGVAKSPRLFPAENPQRQPRVNQAQIQAPVKGWMHIAHQ